MRARDPAPRDLERPQSRDVVPAEFDPARARPVDPVDRVEKGCLAGAVRADETEDLALVDAEGHRVAGDQTAETHGDALNVEDHWMYARSRGNRLRSDPTSPAVTKSTVRSNKSPAIASWKFANVEFVMRKPRSHS